MAYIQPMVQVYQEYESTSVSTQTAELPSCIIGPCYHIVDAEEDEILALVGTYTGSEGMVDKFFPNNSPGALIDADSVKVRLKNALVQYITGRAVAASSPFVRNEISFDTTDFFDKIAVGDIVDIVDNTDNTVHVTGMRVLGVNADTGVIVVNRSLPDLSGVVTPAVNFFRKVEEIFVTPDSSFLTLDVTSERFTLVGVDCGLDDGVFYPVAQAEAYVGYRALRQDLSDIITLYDVNEIQGKLGKIVPENPLAYGVSICMANSSDVGIRCVAVDSDDLIGYTAVKDKLENITPVYAIVPLTFSPAVLAMFKNHAIAMSQPEIGRWRMAIGCQQMVHTLPVDYGMGSISRDGDGDLVILTASTDNTMFLSNDADAGDTLIMEAADGTQHKYTIGSVVAEDILTIIQSEPFDPAVFAEGTQYAFTISRTLDKLGQANQLANTSKAYGSHRYVSVWPDVCVIDGRELPGYYLCCALAGGISSLPSHYGMTRLSIAGIDAVKNSSDYFNQSQLDVIAGGGTLIFVQISKNAPPYIRHQLTSDLSTIEFQELSFVKNFDYISYICKDVLDVFIGRWNITPATLQSLSIALNGTLETLKLDSQPKIGSRVLDYKINSVTQLENVRDRVEMYADVALPYPLNTIGLHLRAVHMQIVSSN